MGVVASQVGGIPELVIQGNTGWTVKNDRTDEWILTIQSILDNADLANRVGENAKQHVMRHFSWKTEATNLMPIFEEALTDR